LNTTTVKYSILANCQHQLIEGMKSFLNIAIKCVIIKYIFLFNLSILKVKV